MKTILVVGIPILVAISAVSYLQWGTGSPSQLHCMLNPCMNLGEGVGYQGEHYTIEITGLKETYLVGERYSFSYIISGYGYMCGRQDVTFPDQHGNPVTLSTSAVCTEEAAMEDFSFDVREYRGTTFGHIKILNPGTYAVSVAFDTHTLESPAVAVEQFDVMDGSPRYERYLDEDDELNFGLMYDKDRIAIDPLQRILDWCDYPGDTPEGLYFDWNNSTHHIDSEDCEWRGNEG